MVIGADRFVDHLDPEQAKKHATQRYQRGYSDIDMWNFDTFLADVIVVGCQSHIHGSIACPSHMTREEWRQTLIDIRNGFLRRDSNGAPNPPKAAWKLLRKNFKYLWD